jgi:hypothetical protein
MIVKLYHSQQIHQLNPNLLRSTCNLSYDDSEEEDDDEDKDYVPFAEKDSQDDTVIDAKTFKPKIVFTKEQYERYHHMST